MANQKIYSIKIDGLEKSISEIDVLTAQIDELEKKLNKISKSKVDVDVKSSKELAENTKLQTDEYKKQIVEKEKIKKVNDEIKKQQKEIAQGVRDSNGEYTNTLAGQRAYLAEIKKQLSTTDLNSDEWVTLRDRVSEVNESVKQLEQSYGVFTRNVGNYESAANGFVGLKESANEAGSALEQLRQNAKFQVDLNGQIIEFETLSQAIGEIDDLAQKASAQMQQLSAAGQENSDAYREAAETFQLYVNKAGELEKARKYSDEMKDSLASQTRELDLTVQGFQAVTGAMQLAAGVQGLFGKDQQELNEAMNKTIQLMGIAQGVQELYNQTVQSGTLLNKVYTASQAGVNKAIAALGVSAKASSAGVKVLKVALNGLGIGLIITAVSLLVEHWEDLVGWFKQTGTVADKVGNAFNKLKQIFMGLGNVILQYIIQPFKGAFEAISALFQGDFAGAAEAVENSLKNQFNVVQNYQKGVTAEAKKQAEKQEKIKKEQLDKELEYKIQTMEAMKDADWKYTVEGKRLYDKYYQNKLSLYDKDSDEYKQAILEKLKYQKDYEAYILKEEIETKKKAQENEEKRLKKQTELNQKFIEQTKEAFELVKEANEFISRQSLQAFKASSLNYQKAIAFYEMLSRFNPNELGTPLTLFGESIEDLEKQLDDNFEKINNIYNTVFVKIKVIQKWMRDEELLNFKNEQKNSEANIANQLVDQLLEVEKVLTNSPEIENIKAQMETLFYVTAKEGYSSDNVILQGLEQQLSAYNEYLETFTDDKLKNMTKKQREELALNQQQYNDLLNIFKTYLNEMQYLQKDYNIKVEQYNKEQIEQDREFLTNRFAFLSEAYEYEYNDLLEVVREKEQELDEALSGNQDVDIVAKLVGNRLNAKKYENAFNLFKEQMINTVNEIDKEIKNFEIQMTSAEGGIADYMSMLGLDPEKWEDRITADPVLQQLIDEKNAIENQIVQLKEHKNAIEDVQRSVNQVFEDAKLNFADYTQIIASVTNVAMQISNKISEMLYNNETKRIENEQEMLDDELAALDEQLAAKEELYNKYNDKINTLEDELETARGSRRDHLLNEIAKEMDAREKAFNEQKKIELEQQRIEQQKEKLQEQARQAEIRRLKSQKVTDIAEATINTAVAVTKALKTSRIYAAVVAALGAAQISTIAATRYYSEGGLLQGPSHANGGIKVLGGTAEVEGHEFITNKKTTAQNVDLLYFINSKKRKLDISDFIEFYSTNKHFSGNRLNYNGNYKYANGGILPKDLNTRNVTYIQDDRPVVVSVVEIENVMNNVKNVRALAGL